MGERHEVPVVVIGAGLAGLTAAATAARAGRLVVVVEADALGGRARTDEHGGYRFNQGPHALARGGRAERILRDLGVPHRAPPGGSVVHVMRYGARDPARDGAELRGHARLAGLTDDQIVEERFLAVHVVTHVVPSPDHGLAGRPGVEVAGAPGGDEERVLNLLDPDVVLISDAGPDRRAARVPVVGAKRVQQLVKGGWRLLGYQTRPSPDQLPPARLLEVNSSPSLVVDTPNGPIVVTAEAVDGRVTSVWVRLNPDKTAALEDPPPIV
jgi:glycine/D-amino acid oxidase-like deaminating enzyme